jgi:hypothetical protein
MKGIDPDNADFLVLSLANEKRKFAIPLFGAWSPEVGEAIERGFDRDWFRLIDVAQVAAQGGEVCRIFRLTPAGLARLAELSTTRPRQ